MVSYFASGFVYAKVANLVLFFRADPRLGLVYLLLFILQGMLLPEPTYKGTHIVRSLAMYRKGLIPYKDEIKISDEGLF